MGNVAKEYALYKGDKLITLGTAEEIANYCGVSAKTIHFYKSPAYKKRGLGEKSNNRLLLIDIENSPKRWKKVEQYDLNDNYIQTWDSARQINETLGINISNISQVCIGSRNKAGGYKWKYAKN